MEVGSSNSAQATLPQSTPAQEIRQADAQQQQAVLEASTDTAPPANTPTSDSRVGSIINTQA